MIPNPKPYDLTLYDRLVIKGLIRSGFTLKHIAGVLKVTVHELDLALWNSLGRRH